MVDINKKHMDYNHIKNFLEKFKIILSSKEELYETISIVIEKNTQIKIETRFIQTKGTDILIKASPIVRGEILIKKNQILLDLKELKQQNCFFNIK